MKNTYKRLLDVRGSYPTTEKNNNTKTPMTFPWFSWLFRPRFPDQSQDISQSTELFITSNMVMIVTKKISSTEIIWAQTWNPGGWKTTYLYFLSNLLVINRCILKQIYINNLIRRIEFCIIGLMPKDLSLIPKTELISQFYHIFDSSNFILDVNLFIQITKTCLKF